MAVTIETDICIVGAGSVGLFAVLEAGDNDMNCCILDTGSEGDEDVKELALCQYLRLAAAKFNPVYSACDFLKDITKQHDDTYLVTTSSGNKIQCKYVVFTKTDLA